MSVCVIIAGLRQSDRKHKYYARRRWPHNKISVYRTLNWQRVYSSRTQMWLRFDSVMEIAISYSSRRFSALSTDAQAETTTNKKSCHRSALLCEIPRTMAERIY